MNEKFLELKNLIEGEIEKLGLITVREAEDIRGVTRSAILQLVKRGRLSAEYLMGKPMVYRAEIENFVNDKVGRHRHEDVTVEN